MRFATDMRNVFIFLVSVFIASNSLQAQPIIKVKSEISEVRVFRNQAQVKRNGILDLAAGEYQLLIEKVSPFLMEGSVELTLPEGVEIRSVNSRPALDEVKAKPQEVVLLEDSLELLKRMLFDVAGDKESIAWQRDLLQTNKSIGGANQGVKAEELEDMLGIFEKKLLGFKEESIRLNQKEKTLKLAVESVEAKLNAYKAGSVNTLYEILVQVNATKNLSAALFTVQYNVTEVSWEPLYDIRAVAAGKDLDLILKARIKQSTGENWNQVKMWLSTADPQVGIVKPELQPQRLYFETQGTMDKVKRVKSVEAAMATPDAYAAEALKTEAVQNQVNLQFVLGGNHSVASDNASHILEVDRQKLPAKYGYMAVPKLANEVYVTARVMSNDLINQLNGEASIYFEGSYIGKTWLAQESSDSLTLTLGRDKRLLISREKVKEMCAKSFLGSTRKESQIYEITITNSGKESATINVQDQIPLATHSDMSVKLTESSQADFNPETGFLIWQINIAPGATSKLRFGFDISYPSDKRVTPY